MLRRALANLLSNAVHCADVGTTIKFSVKKEDDGMDISMENTGTTIGANHLVRLFERCYRADA
ncbi:ATP-binding protein [Undibacterium sp. Ji42W]|uniref:ATP-binding protein n=1 Tax=Undibacterium sp. Ji42W TaxID=3413039 RepID=UPI003BF2A2C9